MNVDSSNATLGVVSTILADFQGQATFEVIDRDTRFFRDLGLASIDAVVLGEILEAHYAVKLPFGELFATLGARTDRDMTIGELVDFLDEHLPNDDGTQPR